MNDLRVTLDGHLKDHNRTIEEQEKIIEYVHINRLCADTHPRILVDLDQSDEPAWTYLEYQHAHIIESLRNIYSKAKDTCQSKSAHLPC